MSAIADYLPKLETRPPTNRVSAVIATRSKRISRHGPLVHRANGSNIGMLHAPRRGGPDRSPLNLPSANLASENGFANFTELQGIVGGLYAAAPQGEFRRKSADAVYDHYRPVGL